MPIDRSGSPRSVGQGDQEPEPGPGQLRLTRRADAHQALHHQALGPAPVHERRGLGRVTAPAVRQPGQVHLHEHAGAGRPLGDLDRQPGPVDGLPQVHERGELAHLVGLEAADEVPAPGAGPAPRSPASSTALARSSWA